MAPTWSAARAGAGVSGTRIGGVVLAAGASRRMGTANKLLLDVGGRPLVAWPVEAMEAAGIDPLVIVTGPSDARVRAALADRNRRFVHNADADRGMGSSIAVGVAALADEVDVLLICLGDLPRLRPSHVRAVLGAVRTEPEVTVVVPTHDGRRGHPVAFRAQHFAALRALEGDFGARGIVHGAGTRARELVLESPAILRDVDTPAALAELDDGG